MTQTCLRDISALWSDWPLHKGNERTMWVESHHKQNSTKKVTTRFNKLIHILSLFFSLKSETFLFNPRFLALRLYIRLFRWQGQRGQRSFFRVLVDVTRTDAHITGKAETAGQEGPFSHSRDMLTLTQKTASPIRSQALYSCTELLCVVVLGLPALRS